MPPQTGFLRLDEDIAGRVGVVRRPPRAALRGAHSRRLLRHNDSVASSSNEVRQPLRRLQAVIREHSAEAGVRTLRDSRSGTEVRIQLTRKQVAAMEAAERAIAADENFEYLAPAQNEVEVFAADSAADRKADHVKPFMDRYRKETSERVCYFGVEYLSTVRPAEISAVRLLPRDDAEIPSDNPLFQLDSSISCVAAVTVTGTGEVPMAARARQRAEHALRLLRIALRETPGLDDRQLRFRLGISYAFSSNAGGWQAHEGIAYPVELPADLAPTLAVPVAGLPLTAPRKSINEKALLAVHWLDRAFFMTDPLVATLFRFFALEALLGDSSEGLKSGLLAFRQMTLSRIATGYFRHPDETLLQYEEVRSYAVHGEIAPDVTPERARAFEWAVRDTLNQYLAVAVERGFTRRKQLTDLLDEYPGRNELITWIRENGSPEWTAYLDRIARDQGAVGMIRQGVARLVTLIRQR